MHEGTLPWRRAYLVLPAAMKENGRLNAGAGQQKTEHP